jgi:hypothetical protein
MKKAFVALALLSMIALPCPASVVKMAPNFTWESAGRANSLRSVKGQPVVLIIAKNARMGVFKAQVNWLRKVYEDFASRKVIFAAAIENGEANIHSDIPFVIVNNAAQVAADFGVNDSFAVIVIGRDGNVDYQTSKVLTGMRIRDVIVNSFVEQSERRK